MVLTGWRGAPAETGRRTGTAGGHGGRLFKGEEPRVLRTRAERGKTQQPAPLPRMIALVGHAKKLGASWLSVPTYAWG